MGGPKYAYLRTNQGDDSLFVHVTVADNKETQVVFQRSWIDDDDVIRPTIQDWSTRAASSKIRLHKHTQTKDYLRITGRMCLRRQGLSNVFGASTVAQLPAVVSGVIGITVHRRKKLLEIMFRVLAADMQRLDISRDVRFSDEPHAETVVDELADFDFDHIVWSKASQH
jgi:hypothetical protein